MNTRTLLIIAAVAVPVVALGILVNTQRQADHSAKPVALSSATAGAPRAVAPQVVAPVSMPMPPKTREQAIAMAKDRLAKLQAMKPETWETERWTLSPPGRAKTLEQARTYSTTQIEKLQAMTDEQFNAEQRLNQQRASASPQLPVQQQTPVQRLPNINPPAAGAPATAGRRARRRFRGSGRAARTDAPCRPGSA